MKRFMKILSLGAAVLMLAGSLAACSGKPGAGLDLISEGKLVMGTNAFFPPFEYKEGGEVVGVDVDIVKAIAEKLDLTFEVKGDIEFDSLPESLKAKDIDLIAAGLYRPRRPGRGHGLLRQLLHRSADHHRPGGQCVYLFGRHQGQGPENRRPVWHYRPD